MAKHIIIFWKAKEPFPNKALPPFFKDLEKKFFIINKPVTIEVSLATPWFDQPGLGEKHVVLINDQEGSKLARVKINHLIKF